MRSAIFILGIFAVTPAISAQQAGTQYVISTRILAGGSPDASSFEVLASPTFRVRDGRSGTMDLGDDSNSLRLAVTPFDLAGGRIAVRIVAETRRDSRIQASRFDLLTGADATAPTVALRDDGGAFMRDAKGRQLFIEVSARAIIR